MNECVYASDLVVLTADKNMKFAIQGLLSRPEALTIRPVSSVFFIHPESDPGCLLHADDFLRPFIKRIAHAVVMFDREGCEKEKNTRDELETEVVTALSRTGWEDRATAVVIDPELENWVFSDSAEVDTAMGWKGKIPPLRTWLESRNFLAADRTKPSRPKEAMEAALRHARMPRSSSIYGQLAARVAIGRCSDSAFKKLTSTLQAWFPASR